MTCAQTVSIGACEADGPNANTNSSNYVVQYPKQYRRTDGKWLAVGSLIGTVIGGLVNADILNKAKSAEDDWRDMTRKMSDKGEWLFTTHADKILACVDKLHEKLCALAECGYKPDYEAMFIRTRASAMAVTEIERRKLCRTATRFKTGLNRDVHRSLSIASIQAQTNALSVGIDTARKATFEINYKMLYDLASLMESHYITRMNTGATFVRNATISYDKLTYSYRTTAKADTGDWAKLGGTLATLIPLFLKDFNDPENDCDTGTTTGGGIGGLLP